MIDLFGQIFLYFDFNVPQQSSFKSNKQLIVMRIFYSHFAWCLVFQRLGYCISISGLWIRIFLTPNFYARYFCNCQLRLNKWQRLLLYRNEIILKAKLQTICCFVSLEKNNHYCWWLQTCLCRCWCFECWRKNVDFLFFT